MTTVKELTIGLASLLLMTGCGKVEVREYTEEVQVPENGPAAPVPVVADGVSEAGTVSEAPAGVEAGTDVPAYLRAAPLEVAAVPENLPPDHPTLAESDGPAVADPNAMRGREDEVPPPPEAGDLTWEAPPGWTARAGGGMRVAEFVPGDAPDGVVATLIALGGMGGDVDANIARWRRQVGLPPTGSSKVEDIEGKMPFTFVSLVEESREAELPVSTIAAIYRLPDRSVFLKFMGPVEVVADHKLDFLQLAGSIRVRD